MRMYYGRLKCLLIHESEARDVILAKVAVRASITECPHHQAGGQTVVRSDGLLLFESLSIVVKLTENLSRYD